MAAISFVQGLGSRVLFRGNFRKAYVVKYRDQNYSMQ